MAERKKNPKAENAMALANKYKEILALADLMRAKLWEIAELEKTERSIENRPVVLGMPMLVLLAARKTARAQAEWHNIAFGRGYFDVVVGPRKLSKSDVHK